MKLSYTQRKVLRAMDQLGAHGNGDGATAREIASRTNQSSDGAAYTLRSLVRRELVDNTGHDGDRYGYRLTVSGLAESRDEEAWLKL